MGARMRYRRSVLIAALVSILLASSLFAQTNTVGRGLDTMVLVPAGWFIMGGEEYDNEKPRRQVYLDKFFIDKYPVTNARFQRFGSPGHLGKSIYGSKFSGDRQPVVGVTWFQARDYCKSVWKRLPTEAEWEKAARGVDGRKYPWGGQWDPTNVIWHKNSDGKTHPVDRTYNTHRSPYGAVDMSGNVWEWVSDWYGEDYYQNAPARNPKGPATGPYRVYRGGSWGPYSPAWFRAASRYGGPPDLRGGGLGFRCAKAP
jgi:sulfatase modifying factor 1